MRRGKRKFALIKEAEAATDFSDFRTAYPITKNIAYGYKYYDGSVRELNDRTLIQDDESWKTVHHNFFLDEIATINALKQGEIGRLVSLSPKLFIACLADSANLQLSFVRKSWESYDGGKYPCVAPR